MATLTTLRKPNSTAPRRRRMGRRLRRQNKKLLRWLDSWLATPNDHGEAWWAEFEAELQSHAVTFPPNQPG